MSAPQYLDIFAAIAAFIAAAFWFRSAYGKLPPVVAYWGGGGAPDNDPFYKALKFSASMNKWAAAFSGVSALCMGIKLFIGS